MAYKKIEHYEDKLMPGLIHHYREALTLLGEDPEREGLLKVSDDAALVKWIDEVFAEHPAEVQRYLAGERRLQGVLVGYVMKQSKGSADPKRVNQLLAARVGT